MHSDQWKTAGEQLLGHWKRSGISYVPASDVEGVAAAKDWLELNEAHLAFEKEALGAASLTPVSSSSKTFQPDPAVVGSTPTSTSTSNLSPNVPTANLPETANQVVNVPRPVAPKVGPNVSGLPLLGTIQPWGTGLDSTSRIAKLAELNQEVNACRKCEEIVCRRQRTVFGVGPSNARIAMFGEAPGADEDRVGEPFVGAAGQLLDKILVASGLKRDEVYILNALKCRPPNNRTPVDAEIENCRPFFESQLEIIQPNYIVCWGSIAVRAVLKSTESVGRLRGRFHAYQGAKVMVTYHPAYLLRNADAKRLTWEDMKMLMRELGIPIAGSSGTK